MAATNPPFAERDEIPADPRLRAAVADRVTFFRTGAESYRYRATEVERVNPS